MGRSTTEAAIGLVADGVHFTGEFVRAIKENRPYEPNFVDGFETMRVIEAALASSRERRAVGVPPT